ncbi:sphingomyelin synthase-related protein 1-like [Saccoglossus kowalevskii]
MFSMKEEPERHTCIDINNGRIGNNVNGTSTDVISPYAEYRSRSPKKKLGISVIYYMICMWIASFCSVLANDWVPDKKFHPSLPDIVFDNTPILPHGNTVTDWLIMCIVVLSLAVVLSNKNRLIIFRHFFCSICTMYLMRSVTILVTPLPVPASNLPCWPQTDGSLQSILKATLTHYTSASITVKKGILCGD